MLDQELNMTRRVTRPYVPEDNDDFRALRKQRDFMEEPALPDPVRKPLR